MLTAFALDPADQVFTIAERDAFAVFLFHAVGIANDEFLRRIREQ